ncbi:hypothetical protein [Streptodolium elevatio]|uniref:Uncharacterized protein n=1 Tax=Streptodolium elevatio TaxID=3157996 RepID=A0ABV3DLD7_9ACTN
MHHDDPIQAVRDRLRGFLRGDADVRDSDVTDGMPTPPELPELPDWDEPLPRDRWGRVKRGVQVG